MLRVRHFSATTITLARRVGPLCFVKGYVHAVLPLADPWQLFGCPVGRLKQIENPINQSPNS
jgi:hypothetical protein